MTRAFLLLLLVVQLSFRGIESDYQVLVTVHSLILLESRCAECYGMLSDPIQRNSCCDGANMSSCPDGCDILLRFCQLSDLPQFNLADTVLLGTQCRQSTVFSHVEDRFKSYFKAGETLQFDEVGSLGGVLKALSNPVTYNETGKWKGAQLNISVTDRDPALGDFDDLIDYFMIPINISAGSSVTKNFTGRYNYVQLELTIEVTCTANNTDESCVCLPGFSGLFCVNNIDDCVGVTCNDRGRCVDGVQTFSCDCDPGYTGAFCESDMAMFTPAPVAAIAGGVIGGVLIMVVLILALVLLIIKQKRSKTFGVQGNEFDSSQVVLGSGDVCIHDEAAGNITGLEILKEFKNPIYGDDPKLKHEYEITDANSNDQYQELERKFDNPIYGDEDDGNIDNAILVHERNIEYDQVGNIYHTLENDQEKQQRYAEPGQATVASVNADDSSHKGKTKKPLHSYEDVQ